MRNFGMRLNKPISARCLMPEGLYVSHLFTDEQVALTNGWLKKIVPIETGDLRHLRLFRPSAIDLILTKMMRNDRQDLEDIGFILSQEKIDIAELGRAFAEAKPLALVELQQIFIKMQPEVLEMAARASGIGNSRENIRHNLDPDWWSKLIQPSPEIERSKEKDRGIEL